MENITLKERIDKAIKYIEEEIDGNGELCLFEEEVEELLEILKGE